MAWKWPVARLGCDVNQASTEVRTAPAAPRAGSGVPSTSRDVVDRPHVLRGQRSMRRVKCHLANGGEQQERSHHAAARLTSCKTTRPPPAGRAPPPQPPAAASHWCCRVETGVGSSRKGLGTRPAAGPPAVQPAHGRTEPLLFAAREGSRRYDRRSPGHRPASECPIDQEARSRGTPLRYG